MSKLFLLPILLSFILLIISRASPISAAAPIGNYLVLNGGYVKTANSNLSIPTSFNFSASITPNNISGKQVILSVGDKNIGKRYYEIGINDGLLYVDYGYQGFNSRISTSGLTAGNWQDISIVITTSQTKLYINGQQVAGPFITNSLGPIGPNIVLGDSYKESFFDLKPFKGLIDEVNILNGTNNILQWHLDEARGVTTAADSSGNNLIGTLVGGDSLIHFFGVLPSPTPTPTRVPFGLSPINWQRPILPTLSFPRRINPPDNSINPPANSPPPTPFNRFMLPRRGESRVTLQIP